MGRLNAPRTMPYDFRVIEFGHEVVLIDASEHIYPCSTRPHFDFESLYELMPEVGDTCWNWPSQCEHVHREDAEEDLASGEYECPRCGYPYDGLAKLTPGLLLASGIDLEKSEKVLLDEDEIGPDVPREDAWNAAREEAQANHYL